MSDLEELERLLADADSEARRVAVQKIARHGGSDAAGLLVRALGDEDWRVRKEAATMAPTLDARDELLRELARVLDDKANIGLRNGAVEALIGIGPDAVPIAVAALEALDADGRKLATEILGGVLDARGVPALGRALADEDANVRAGAAEALGHSGLASEEARAEATAALVGCLSSREPQVTLAALDALGRLDAKLPYGVYESLAKDPLFRRYALVVAARSREDAALLALVNAVADASPTIAREALVALGSWLVSERVGEEILARARAALRAAPRGRERVRSLARDREDGHAHSAALVALGLLREEEDVHTLVESLGDEDVAEYAATALELFGRLAAPALARLFPTAPQATRAVLLSLIPRLDPVPDAALLTALRDGLNDAAADVALAAMRALASLGEETDLARLVPMTNHYEGRVALAAATAIRALTARYPTPSRQLLGALAADGQHVIAGCAIVSALAAAGTIRDEEVAFVERALAKGDPRARRMAVDALGVVGGPRAAEAVAFALADEESDVRLAAVRALGRVGHIEPLTALVGSSSDSEVVAAALRALGEADRDVGFSSARPLVTSPDLAIAFAAIEAIGRSDAPGRADALFEALEHPDDEVVKLALSELSSAADARALARIGACLDHASWEVRRLASEILGQSKSAVAQAFLRARLEREREPIVRDALTEALSLRPPPGFEAG